MPSVKAWLCDTLISDFWPPGLGKNKRMLPEHHSVSVTPSQQPGEKKNITTQAFSEELLNSPS